MGIAFSSTFRRRIGDRLGRDSDHDDANYFGSHYIIFLHVSDQSRITENNTNGASDLLHVYNDTVLRAALSQGL